MKKDLTKIFIDDIYSKPPKKIYETKETINNHFDKIWSTNLADFSD